MAKINNKIVRFSEGTGRNLGKATNKTASWGQLQNRFSKPTRTAEKFKDYMAMSDADQKYLKAIAGWLYRTQIEGTRRNRSSGLPSDLVSMDYDYTNRDFLDKLLNGEIVSDWAWFLHTTRSHTPEAPRFRIYFLLNEPVSNDMYGAVSRIMAQEMDPSMENVDKVSFRPAQMMYFPTASKDGEYIFHVNEGEPVDWSELLDVFEAVQGDWRVISNLPKVPDEHLRESAEKMEDPTQKPGIVGDFCRAFDIFEAIAEFDLPYTESDTSTAETPRFTYTLGGSSDGAIVYDGGLYLYSHHGTDPVSDMEVNAFDLVRMHKFADLDKDTEFDAKMNTRPSWKAMVDFCKGNEKFRQEQIKSRYDLDELTQDYDDMGTPVAEEEEGADADLVPEEGDEAEEDDFSDIELSDEEEGEIEKLAGKPDEDRVVGLTETAGVFTRKIRPPAGREWIGKLAMTQDGNMISNLPNVTRILDNDGRTRNCIAFNEHMQEIVLIRKFDTRLEYVDPHDVRDQVNGDLWEDSHSAAARTFMEEAKGKGLKGYAMKPSKMDIKDALLNMSRKNSFHPVQEYLNFCYEQFEPENLNAAKDRLGRLWSDYLGSPDDAYHRDTAVKFMVACVARAFEPGHKFDYSPILHGAQGVGKSTFVAILAQHWYGELSADFDNPQKLVEQMQGCWIMELPELSSITRGQVEDVKAFISGTSTKARLAYATRAGSYLRQTCFIGSTNDTEFLVDTTGNRRWWPIEVSVDAIDLDRLRGEIQELWACAMAIYKSMRQAQPEGFLTLHLSDPDVRKIAEDMQEQASVEGDVGIAASRIAEWLDAYVDDDDDFHDMDASDGQPRVRERRTKVCMAQLAEFLDMPANIPNNWGRMMGKTLRKLGWEGKPAEHFPGYGKPKVFKPSIAIKNRWMDEDLERFSAKTKDDPLNLV